MSEKKSPEEKATRAERRAQLLVDWLKHREEGKSHYEAAEAAFKEIRLLMRPGAIIGHPVTGEQFRLIDQFHDRDVVFKPCGVNRYDLKPIPGTKKTPVE